MRILFAAHEDAWGGIFFLMQSQLPQHQWEATGRFGIDHLKGYDVLIPTMTKVTADWLAESNGLRLIQQCGAGLEGIDIEAARRRNIWVANVPTGISGNADSVAELGIYLMIGLSRDAQAMARNLAESKVGQPMGRALKGKTVGLVGLGGIGHALIRRLRPFDVHLIGIKRRDHERAREELNLEWTGGPADLKTLLEKSDYVILCLPLTPESHHMINRSAFAAMRQDAFIVNLSRGGLIDRDALQEALASGKIAGAGLDVFWEEPPDPQDPIFQYRVLATPHVGGATDISGKGIVAAVTENIRRLGMNQEPLHLAWQEK